MNILKANHAINPSKINLSREMLHFYFRDESSFQKACFLICHQRANRTVPPLNCRATPLSRGRQPRICTQIVVSQFNKGCCPAQNLEEGCAEQPEQFQARQASVLSSLALFGPWTNLKMTTSNCTGEPYLGTRQEAHHVSRELCICTTFTIQQAVTRSIDRMLSLV